MPSKILFTSTAAELVEDAREMSPAGFDLVIAAPGSAEYTAALEDAEYLLGNVQGMDDAFYRAAPRLRLIQLFSAGYDHVDLNAARRAGVPVSNNGGANSRAVAWKHSRSYARVAFHEGIFTSTTRPNSRRY